MHMYVDVIMIIIMMTIMIIMIIMIIIMIMIMIMIQCTYYRSHENVWNSNSISKHVFKVHIYQQILVSNRNIGMQPVVIKCHVLSFFKFIFLLSR